MKQKFFFLLMVLVMSSFEVIAQQQEEPQGVYMEGRGKFFRISGNGLSKPSYVLGTMHVVPGEYAETIAGLKEALAEVEQVACELKVSNFEQNANHLAPKTWSEYDSLMVERGKKFLRKDGSRRPLIDDLNAKELDSFKGAMNLRLGVWDQSLWIFEYVMTDLRHVYENKLNEVFRTYGFEAKNFDTGIDEYVTETMLSDRQLPFFELDKKNLENDAVKEKSEVYKILWSDKSSRKQLAKMAYRQAMYFGKFSNVSVDAEIYFKDLPLSNDMTQSKDKELEERNALWMTKLPDIINAAPTIIVVGLLHLHDTVNGEGILHRLERLGYKIERVEAVAKAQQIINIK